LERLAKENKEQTAVYEIRGKMAEVIARELEKKKEL